MRKTTKNYECYIPQTRTEYNSKPLSKEQIEDAGRKAMRLICKALEENPTLRDDVKEYVKSNPENKNKKMKDIRPQIIFGSHNINTQMTSDC